MLIIGAKGFAKEVLEVLHQQNKVDEISFFDDVSLDVPDVLYNKFGVIKSLESAVAFYKNIGDNKTILGVGGPLNRYKLFNKFVNIGGKFEPLISPYAKVGHFENCVGEGVIIMTGSVLTNSISIARGSLVNLNCTIGHDCIIGEFVEMSPGTHISGSCNIGNYCQLGTNSTVLPSITLGENVIVGAGCVITKNIPDNSLVVGVPGKVIKSLDPIELNN